MPSLQTASVTPVDPRLARTLWQWLVLGVLAIVLLPAARGDSMLLGWLPFWLAVVPATALLTLHRHTLVAALRRGAHVASRARRVHVGACRGGAAAPGRALTRSRCAAV